MAPVVVEPEKLRSFRDQGAFWAWLERHHDRESEIWIRFYKKGSGVPSLVYREALDLALCFGWIDGQSKGLDDVSYMQRFTPRTKRSSWSQVNREHVARLEAEGRMTVHGRRQIEAAKADGRWDAAYASPSKMTLPDDLAAAIAADPRAAATLAALDRQSRYALAFRTQQLKTPAGRAKKIAAFVALLASGKGPLDDTRWSPKALASRRAEAKARMPSKKAAPKKETAAKKAVAKKAAPKKAAAKKAAARSRT